MSPAALQWPVKRETEEDMGIKSSSPDLSGDPAENEFQAGLGVKSQDKRSVTD